jgi:hypothetical protein
MTPLDDCRQVLAESSAQVAATLPPGRARALLTLLRAGDMVTLAGDPAPAARPGWNLALRLCLERHDDEDGVLPADRDRLAAWAERFLAACDQLALASLALAQCASGHLHLQQRAPRTFVAWATSRRLAPEAREQDDFSAPDPADRPAPGDPPRRTTPDASAPRPGGRANPRSS